VLFLDVAVGFELEDVLLRAETAGKGTLAEVALEVAVQLGGGGGGYVAGWADVGRVGGSAFLIQLSDFLLIQLNSRLNTGSLTTNCGLW